MVRSIVKEDCPACGLGDDTVCASAAAFSLLVDWELLSDSIAHRGREVCDDGSERVHCRQRMTLRERVGSALSVQ